MTQPVQHQLDLNKVVQRLGAEVANLVTRNAQLEAAIEGLAEVNEKLRAELARVQPQPDIQVPN